MQQLLVKKAHVNEDLLPLGGAGILERGVYASSSSRVNYPQLSPGLFTGQPQTSQLQTIFCLLPTHLQTLTGTLCWQWRYNSWCNCLWQDTEASWPWTTCQPALGGLCQHSGGYSRLPRSRSLAVMIVLTPGQQDLKEPIGGLLWWSSG